MEKVQNLLKFSDFKKLEIKDAKKTKRTEVGLDIIEEKFMDDEDELIDVDDDINDDIEDVDDIDIEEDDVDEDEGGDWKEELTSLINQIIEDGADPSEVYGYLDEISDEYEGEEDEDEDEDDEEDDEDEDEDYDDEDFDVEPEETSDEEDIADDDEGAQIGESLKSFKKWNR